MSMSVQNPIGLNGIEFIEYASSQSEVLEALFYQFGFQKTAQHKTKNVDLYQQNDVNFIINKEEKSFSENFQKLHGPSICATGFKVEDADKAMKALVERGARKFEGSKHNFPAIYGIGESLIYFIDKYGDATYRDDFNFFDKPKKTNINLAGVDHLTNNVPVGKMNDWCDFYEKLFNFRETRYFDIQGEKTGLISKVMTSPCKKIIIPINEPKDDKSQIQEYIEEYKGSGIQHLAFYTKDICASIAELRKQGVEFLDVPDTYYEVLKDRVPGIVEDIGQLKELRILADGDDEGYLLQIFTKNVIGPIFFEIIQRKNHYGFGEGNFQALFEAIEKDQKTRGYL